jgi:Threonine dehydrogenase and related Zn-dependent dehydrogenases
MTAPISFTLVVTELLLQEDPKPVSTMKACVIEAPGTAAVTEVPIPEPGPGEVLVRVERAGVCGTDIHIFKGEYVSPYPIIPGHEFAGTIAGLGAGVAGLAIGDRVTAEPNIHCGRCTYCLSHRGNHCENWQAVGVTRSGAMAEYVAVPAANVFRLPNGMSFAEGAFIEPLACVVHAMNRLRPMPGDRALLFGAGAMGQQIIQALAQSGVSELAVVDVSEGKLAMAAKLGATRTFVNGRFEETELLAEFPRGYDIVVDATGIPEVVEQALKFLGPAGKYLQFGVTAKSATIRLSPFDLFQRDWTLIGSMATNDTFHQALQWAKAKRIRLEPIVTSVIGLNDLPSLLADGARPDDLKVQVQIG